MALISDTLATGISDLLQTEWIGPVYAGTHTRDANAFDMDTLIARGTHEHEAKNTICLWFDKDAHDAAKFYAATFPSRSHGDPEFRQSEAFSFQIATDNQEETDGYWNAIVGNGGRESQCGWCKDRWGLSWQITPRALTDAMAAGGGEAKRAFQAMMPMKKMDASTIEAARRG